MRRSALPRCLTLCILQGASEDAPPKKEKVDKGNENYQKVKEVRPFSQAFSPLWAGSISTKSTKHLSISPRGRGWRFSRPSSLLSGLIGGGGASCGAVVYGFTSGGFCRSEYCLKVRTNDIQPLK